MNEFPSKSEIAVASLFSAGVTAIGLTWCVNNALKQSFLEDVKNDYATVSKAIDSSGQDLVSPAGRAFKISTAFGFGRCKVLVADPVNVSAHDGVKAGIDLPSKLICEPRG